MVFDELLKKALLMKLNADVGSLSYYSLARPLAPPEETVNCPYTSQLLHRSVFDNFQLETKRLELDPKNAQTFSLITSTLKRYREMIHLKPRMTFDAITVSLFELLIKFFQRWENIRNLDADFSTFDLLLAACEANLSSLEPGGRTLVNQQLVPLILNSNVRHKYSHFVIMALKTLKFLLEKMSDDVPIIPNFTGKDVLQIPLRICNSSSNDQKGAVELAWQCASLLKHEATVAESLEALSTVDITGQIPVVESLLRTLDNPDCYNIYRNVGNERNDGIDDFIWALWREIKANFGSRHCHQLYELFSRVLMHEDSFFSRFADLVMEKLFKEIQDKAATRHGMILPIISKYARYCAYPDHKPFLTFAALTSGAGFNKDVLVELHTARKVDELEEQGVLKDIPQNEYQVDILTEMMMVRKYGVDLILRYIKDEVLCNECPPNDVIMMLVKEHIRETKRKQTCHKNSATHLTRERCWQSILLLVTQLIEENIKLKETDAISELVDAILNTLSNEEEPSVRMLQQISLAKLITYSTEEWKKIDQILEDDEFLNYSGSISSVLVVGMLFCISVKIPQFTMKFLEQSLRLQQCSNINVRIHAIAVVNKLYKSTQNDPAQGVAINQMFPFLGRHVQFSDSQKERGSLGRQVDKVMGNMFFSEVNVMDDLSFVGIFRSIPLSVGSQEKNLISLPLLQELSHRTNLPFEKQMDRWAERKWKAANESGDKTPNADVKTEPGVTDVQQKITPWIQDIELEKKSCEGLVICASLIDKANNLGGITRTAEVFGAESLTFDNLSVLKAKDYTSLAVTAMKWIDIQEVKARNIPQWLMSMKNKGYCLAGLEQTANSISIEEFNFPKKCVVVLGNEREGIPAHIIGLLDVVLEIPQKGIIRSLNVHVSAALSIWEYTRGNL
ncbi:Oidioi.mRNA.OKI2018_I69.XSR.g13819.t1.cds [Oikopleura dioica]|uniref:Oidioi.mRNA.OKI2018_I69.XSR.g13819.t1.cds n=1 Tax=Oikopleura dioica TaxID=34765 RepID=A0ABN7S7Z5_OIKDI|nr:Oidioi.mRNA.OKI2018_I69.XSR.g13819.t1.cds [Oikopleura dioica]